MNYFSQFLKSGVPNQPKESEDHVAQFQESWNVIRYTLEHPDERQLARGIGSTDVPKHLKSMVDSLVWESARTEEGTTGGCLEYLLKSDILGILVRLSESDRPSGVQAQVLRCISNMVVLLDEQFLVHTAVHRPVLRLLRTCIGDELEDAFDGRERLLGAAGNAIKAQPSQYEEDLVDLLCTLCSRIRTYRELLMIFFYDKHWFPSHALSSIDEETEDFYEDDDFTDNQRLADGTVREASPTPSQVTVTTAKPIPVPQKPEYEFLLFNYLLRFVHREGRIGDFARAGMLFLMDVAMSAGEPPHKLDGERSPTTDDLDSDPVSGAALSLAEYILEGDFSEVLGAGLSAVYSLLPTKLVLSSSPDSNGVIPITWDLELTAQAEDFGAHAANTLGISAESASSAEFRGKLDHFLTMVEFIQDVLRRNVLDDDPSRSSVSASVHIGAAIVQSVLTAIRRIFLENVLYPSILECSDLDGSATAVMSYVESTLRLLPDGPLVDLFLNFLLSEGDENESPRLKQKTDAFRASQKNESRQSAKMRRGKSSAMLLLEREAPEAQRESEYVNSFGRYTLKDLIAANIASMNMQSAISAFQLLQTLFLFHCSNSVNQLITIVPDQWATSFCVLQRFYNDLNGEESEKLNTPSDEEETFIYPAQQVVTFPDLPSVTYSTHTRELSLYLNLISRVVRDSYPDSFSTGYAHYLEDAMQALTSQRCFAYHNDRNVDINLLHGHRLDPGDRLLASTLNCLCEFFAHPPEYNLVLTGAITSLALCPERSLNGWLVFNTPTATSPGDDGVSELHTEDDDRSMEFEIGKRVETDEFILPASALDHASQPILYSIMNDLISHLDEYRTGIEEFETNLMERRRGLLFSENLQDAMDRTLEPTYTAPSHTSDMSKNVVSESPVPPKQKSKSSSFMSFLTPTKRPSALRQRTPVTTPDSASKTRASETIATGPFGQHYQSTGSVRIKPFVARMPSKGPWAVPQRKEWSAEEEDVFTSDKYWGAEGRAGRPADAGTGKAYETVTLSQLLDNIVILEEFGKELAAIIEARRCLGIDSVRYV